MEHEVWAVITGASAGIGRAFARRLSARGYQLVVAARRQDKLEALARELPTKVETVRVDLAQPAGREQLWQVVSRLPGQVLLLVNNAGFGLRGEVATLSRARQLEMIALNASALVDLTHRYLTLRQGASGAVINVASVVGLAPMPGFAVYGASKSLVVSFSLAVGQEARSQGIRVLTLCPGPVPTEFQETAGFELTPWRRLVAISADQVASEGLAACARGETLWVPGQVMRAAIKAFQLLPAGAATWLASNSRKRRAGG